MARGNVIKARIYAVISDPCAVEASGVASSSTTRPWLVPTLRIALSSSPRIKKTRLRQLDSCSRVTSFDLCSKIGCLHPPSWITTRCHRHHRRTRSRPTPQARPFSNLNDMAHSRPSQVHRLRSSPVTTLAKRLTSPTTSLHASSRTSAKVLGTRPTTAIRYKTHQSPRRQKCRATTTQASA